jgi:dethiobiotin synthetase
LGQFVENMINKQQEINNNKFWIVGTGTEVGKTVVSALFVTGLNASYWKPIQSGLFDGTDTDTVKLLSGIQDNQIIPEVYRLNQPLSPHLSAKIDGKVIKMDNFFMPDLSVLNQGSLVIEAAGGLYVPLNDKDLMIDLVKKLELPTILVCRSDLGTINHSLLSIEALRNRNIPIVGFLTNGIKNAENAEAISFYGGLKFLGHVPQMSKIDNSVLQSLWDELELGVKLNSKN